MSAIETFRVVGDTVHLLAESQSAGGRYEAFETEAVENSGPPLHSHAWSELYYVVAGQVDVTLDGSVIHLSAGDFAQVREGAVHTHRVVSPDARFVTIASPGGISEFFRELESETQGSVEDLGKIFQLLSITVST